MPTKKYFIAIVLPEPLLSKVEAIKQSIFDEHGLKGALRCPAHITLHRPFEWKEEKENVLLEKLSAFRFQGSTSIELKDFAFFEPRVIFVDVLPNAVLNELHKQLKTYAKKEMHLFNEYDDLRGFHPHVTITSRDLKKNLFPFLKERFHGSSFSASFDCKQLCLLKLSKTWEIIRVFDI